MADEMEELRQRLVDLEVRYTHQKDLVEQLSDALYEQQRALNVLTSKISALEKRGSEGSGVEGPPDPEADRPPHY